MTCQWPGCGMPYSSSVSVILNRRRDRILYLCNEHVARTQMEALKDVLTENSLRPESTCSPFEPFIVCHHSDHSMFWIREVNGCHAIAFTTGPAQGYLIQSRLGMEDPPIPSIHDALVHVVYHMDCQLHCIKVNASSIANGQLTIHCGLAIQRNDNQFEVAIKASDAFAMALEVDVPFIVHGSVLRSLPRYTDGLRGGVYHLE